MMKKLNGLVYDYVKTPPTYRSIALDHLIPISRLKSLTLDLYEQCSLFFKNLELKKRMKKKVKWEGIEKLELLLTSRWVSHNSTISNQVVLKELLAFFPAVRNLVIHVTYVNLPCSLEVRHLDAPTFNCPKFRPNGQAVAHYFRVDTELLDMTAYMYSIGSQSRLLETLQLNGAMVSIKGVWETNWERSELESDMILFPRLILLEVDKAYNGDFRFDEDDEWRQWKHKHMRFCTVSSSNYYFNFF